MHLRLSSVTGIFLSELMDPRLLLNMKSFTDLNRFNGLNIAKLSTILLQVAVLKDQIDIFQYILAKFVTITKQLFSSQKFTKCVILAPKV